MRRPIGIAASVKAFAHWAFWRVWYWFVELPSSDLPSWMKATERTSWPWRVFKPHVFRNEDGNMWQVYLSDDADYTERRTLELDVHVSRETGDIIGFNVWDETLRNTEQKEPVHA